MSRKPMTTMTSRWRAFLKGLSRINLFPPSRSFKTQDLSEEKYHIESLAKDIEALRSDFNIINKDLNQGMKKHLEQHSRKITKKG